MKRPLHTTDAMPRIRFETMLAAALLAALHWSAAGAQQPAMTGQDDTEEAESRRYAVEVILFTYADSVSAGTEVFLPEAPPPGAEDFDPRTPVYTDGRSITGAAADGLLPGEENALPDALPGAGTDFDEAGDETDAAASEAPELGMIGAALIDFTPLSPEALSLATAHEELLRLDAYTPVLWGGWTQIVPEEDLGVAINLRRIGNPPLSIDGDLTLYVGRFVHLVVDLRLEEPAALPSLPQPQGDEVDRDAQERRYGDTVVYEGVAGSDAQPWAGKIVHRISEDRIMRNGDVRYFDHPKFGLVARLTLVEEPEDGEGDFRYVPEPAPGVSGPTGGAGAASTAPRR